MLVKLPLASSFPLDSWRWCNALVFHSPPSSFLWPWVEGCFLYYDAPLNLQTLPSVPDGYFDEVPEEVLEEGSEKEREGYEGCFLSRTIFGSDHVKDLSYVVWECFIESPQWAANVNVGS